MRADLLTAAAPADSDLLFAAAPAEIQAADGDAKPARVTIVAYTGGLMTVPGWGPVVVDLAGLDVTAALPLLADHDATLDGIVGTGKATVARGLVTVAGTNERETDKGRKIITLARGGVAFQASVGVRPGRREFVTGGETVQVNSRSITAPAGGFMLIRGGKLRETSITALGADDSTSVSIQAKDKAIMDPTNTNTDPHAAGGNPENISAGAGNGGLRETDQERIRREERERIVKIDRLCAGEDEFADLRARAIAGDLTEDELTRQMLARLRAGRGKGPGIRGGSRQGIDDGRTLEAALLIRAGFESFVEKEYGERQTTAAAEMRGCSLPEFCAAALRMEGQQVPRDRGDMIRAAFSTMTLPTALGNAANKSLLAAYNESPPTWEAFAALRPAANFKDHHSLKPSMLGDLEQVAPDGQLKHGGIDEAVFDWRIDTFGKTFGVNRQDIINDDLSFLDEVLPGFARMARRKLSDIVWAMILANTGSHFHADNNNLQTGGGSVLSVAALGTAIASMRTQRGSSDEDLDIVPRALIHPPELENTAKEGLESEVLQRIADQTAGVDRQPTGNPVRQALSRHVEPRISNTAKFSGASATQWYLFAGPMDAPIVVGFLDGRRTPTAEFFGLSHDANTLGVQWRVYHDFGTAFGDPKAGQKSAGA